MKRSLQEVVELVVFGLIALIIGTGILWLLGWLLGIVGIVFKFVAGLIWVLLRFIIPVAIVAGVIYFIVRVIMNQGKKPVIASPPSASSTSLSAPAATGSAASQATPESASMQMSETPELAKVEHETGFKQMDDLAEKLEAAEASDNPKQEG
jgi:hypothetical protein